MSAATTAGRGPSGLPDLLLRHEPFDSAAATQLIAEVQEEYVLRYGGHDATPVDPAEFAAPTGAFVVGYLDLDGRRQPVACGGVRRMVEEDAGGVAEIKRMYVAREHRRRGLSRILLAALERAAAELGYTEIRLETGDRQPEAMALYASAGYTRIEPYGYYRHSPENACFGKILPPE